jgi:hypothetical protein
MDTVSTGDYTEKLKFSVFVDCKVRPHYASLQSMNVDELIQALSNNLQLLLALLSDFEGKASSRVHGGNTNDFWDQKPAAR